VLPLGPRKCQEKGDFVKELWRTGTQEAASLSSLLNAWNPRLKPASYGEVLLVKITDMKTPEQRAHWGTGEEAPVQGVRFMFWYGQDGLVG
jgi:hypothetical protein